jgi:tetratricopeptide (TPR) repeat protein
MTRLVIYNQTAMQKKTRLIFKILCLFLVISVQAQASDAPKGIDELFKTSLDAVSKNQYDAAQQNLFEALKLAPNSPSILLNLSIASYKKGETGLALGLSRRLLELDPRNQKASQAVRFLTTKITPSHQQADFLQTLHSLVLQKLDINYLLLFTALVMAASGWLWILFARRAKNSREAESAPPKIPLIAGFVSFIFIVMVLVSSLKLWDRSIERGTILKSESLLLSSPDKDGVELMRLAEGAEVHILDLNNNFLKVHSPGAISGWISVESVFRHSQ